MTQLHAGGKFDQNSYKVSGGLHGVGVSVVNALSVWLKLKIRRDGKIHEMSFTHGDADAPLQQTGTYVPNKQPGTYEGRSGTEITFLPVDRDLHHGRVRLQDAGAPPARAGLPQFRRAHHAHATCAIPSRSRSSCYYEGGLEAFVRYLDTRQDAADRARRSCSWSEKDGITVEVAMWWNDSYHENVLCFTNNIPQRDGGTHLAGFRGALTRQVTGYAESSRHRQERKGHADRRRLRARG